MKKRQPITSVDIEIKTLIHYDPLTGIFTNTFGRNGAKAGVEAGRLLNGYRYICFRGVTYLAHRLAWWWVHGALPSGIIDHINRIKDDNRIANLRDTTVALNGQNMIDKPNTKTPFIGAHPNPRCAGWYSKIVVDGKRIYLGTFDTPEAAHAAYMKAKQEHHKGWAPLAKED